MAFNLDITLVLARIPRIISSELTDFIASKYADNLKFKMSVHQRLDYAEHLYNFLDYPIDIEIIDKENVKWKEEPTKELKKRLEKDLGQLLDYHNAHYFEFNIKNF